MNWVGKDLTPKSQALAEGLRRLKAELMPINPRIAETKGGSLTHYTEGKWKNYNTVLECGLRCGFTSQWTCRSSLA